MRKKGFTLIEILITLGVIGMVLASGYFINIDSFSIELVNSEQIKLISILQKARMNAMNNIDASPHGVYIDKDKYVLFRNSSYDPDNSTNEDIAKKEEVEISGLNEIVFDQLSGDARDSGEIVLTDGIRERRIKILENGLIDW